MTDQRKNEKERRKDEKRKEKIHRRVSKRRSTLNKIGEDENGNLLKPNEMKIGQMVTEKNIFRSAFRSQRKVETELELTRRLLAEKPQGIKGLAYVLIELKKAQMQGIIKKQNYQKGNNSNHFSRLGKMI